MNLQEFLNPAERVLAQVVIDYEKKSSVTFGVSDKRCFIFEDTKREQSFISGLEYDFMKVLRPKINLKLVILGVIITIAGALTYPPVALVGVVFVFIAWWLTKSMLLTTEVGVLQMQYLIKKIGRASCRERV